MEREGRAVVRVIHGADILKHVEPNDFVISMRSFQGGIEWCGERGCISSAYVMLIPSAGIVPAFFRYLFKSGLYIQALQSTTNLVRDGQAMRYANFTQIDLPIIPQDEQIRIAGFLDFEIAKIDVLVEEQRRLIDLLKEKRQAVISHAVTKGLNPDAPMKDSDIEWLGQVPAHWSVGALRYFASISTGATPDRTNEQYWGGGIPWVKTGEVNYSTITATEETVSADALRSCSIRIAPPGTLLMCELWNETQAGVSTKTGMDECSCILSMLGNVAIADATDFRLVFGSSTTAGYADRCIFGWSGEQVKFRPPKYIRCELFEPPPVVTVPDWIWDAKDEWVAKGLGKERNRLGEIALRVALIQSGLNGDPEITHESFQAAVYFCEWQARIREIYCPGLADNADAECFEASTGACSCCNPGALSPRSRDYSLGTGARTRTYTHNQRCRGGCVRRGR
jgi:hypothetical protein